ncbi:iron-sulfur cluster assembly accessory protein [Nitrospinae bacterium AH_259_B05_G02_I21]|nr:iron-sulfur cluster assembly accessory protein [Nitrospinae bacterium AH_259_B05_G02_I21]
MGLQLTETAVLQVKRLIEGQGNPELKLRVGVKGGGCSGMSYTLALDTQQREGDEAFSFDDVTVLVDMKSYLFLNGTTLNYVEDVMGGGFKFENPNAERSCGCGSSFS